MKVDKIDSLILETSELLSIPPKQVEDAVKHQFAFLKQHILKPHPTTPTVQLPYLGKFEPALRAINANIRRLIPRVRKDPSLTAQLSALWQHRQLAIKDSIRKDYKKRFGKWHF